MGDLSDDTAVEPSAEGRYSARLSRDWGDLGPHGRLRRFRCAPRRGACSPFGRPASFLPLLERWRSSTGRPRSDHAAIGPNSDVSASLSHTRRRSVLEANVWSVGRKEGLEHDDTSHQIPWPEGLLSREELHRPGRPSPFPFWDNVEIRPVTFKPSGPRPAPLPPVWRAWCRFRPNAVHSRTSWLDSCRSLILIDVQSGRRTRSHHAWKEPHGFIAPSLDLYVAFHKPTSDDSWLLADGHAPVSANGVFGWTGRVWTIGGELAASGAGQALENVFQVNRMRLI